MPSIIKMNHAYRLNKEIFQFRKSIWNNSILLLFIFFSISRIGSAQEALYVVAGTIIQRKIPQNPRSCNIKIAS